MHYQITMDVWKQVEHESNLYVSAPLSGAIKIVRKSLQVFPFWWNKIAKLARKLC